MKRNVQRCADETSISRLAERLDAYAAATVFLSRVLVAPPDGLLLAHLMQPGALEEWPLMEDHHRAGLAALSLSLGRDRESLKDVYNDYQRLFIGPERVLACPYESVYLNDEHLTFGSQTLAVRRWYHRFGLHAPAEGREPDDHIGLELAFVSHLCLQGLEALDHGRDESIAPSFTELADFLSQHLLVWADEFLDHVLAHAATQFYIGVGRLAQGTLRGLERDFTR